MKITLFQSDIAWLSPAVNLQKIEKVLAENPDTDLLILPEMFATGFVLQPKEGDLPDHEEAVGSLYALAKKYNTALCGSLAVTDGDKNYNRCYFVQPNGKVEWSDKRHPFNVGGEGKVYEAGQKKCIVEYMGLRFLMIVCYDLRFPVWSRWTQEEPYDVLICVANWPSARQLAWETLLPARAIENQTYVIGVNRVGADMLCPYTGGTRAIHPYGHIVAQVEGPTEGVCTFKPDEPHLRSYHIKFPAWMDADAFTICTKTDR